MGLHPPGLGWASCHVRTLAAVPRPWLAPRHVSHPQEGCPGCIVLVRTKASHVTKTSVKGQSSRTTVGGRAPQSPIAKAWAQVRVRPEDADTICQLLKSKAAGPEGGSPPPDVLPPGDSDLGGGCHSQRALGRKRMCSVCEKLSGEQRGPGGRGNTRCSANR